MASKHNLGIVDFGIIILLLLISTMIGIHFRYRGDKTTKAYLMGGKNMSRFPVILSISVTFVSAISMIGSPAEVYRYGVLFVFGPLFAGIGIVLAAYVFIPVYFQCGVSTVYEFLEMRYGKTTRYVVSAAFILQMTLYMSCVLYAPILALSAVTNISMDMSVVIFGVVCTVYCAVGGLRGVMWTDVFQSLLIAVCLISLYTAGISDAGGMANIYDKALKGKRLDLNFNLDLTSRYNIWNCISHGLTYGFGCFGANQAEVQRVLSLGDVKKAKTTLLISSLPVIILHTVCCLSGLILFVVFSTCDPVLNTLETGLKKYDQIIPYYIVTRFNFIPGLAGLCVAGIFSGSMSSISSVLNSLVTVTVVDFVQPFISKDRFSESKLLLLSKGLTLFYGCIFIGFTFVISRVSSIVEITTALFSAIDGPTAALFTAGVLSKRVSEKCALFGIIIGLTLTSWVTYGALFSGHIAENLPLSTSSCTFGSFPDSLNDSTTTCFDFNNCSLAVVHPPRREVFFMYKIAYLWIRPLGFLITISCIFLAVLCIGWQADSSPVDPKCLSPLTRFWTASSSHIYKYEKPADNFEMEDNDICIR